MQTDTDVLYHLVALGLCLCIEKCLHLKCPMDGFYLIQLLMGLLVNQILTQGAGLVLDYAGTTNSLYTIAVNKNKHTLRPFQM